MRKTFIVKRDVYGKRARKLGLTYVRLSGAGESIPLNGSPGQMCLSRAAF